MIRTSFNSKAYPSTTIRREGTVEVFCADCGAADPQWLPETHQAETVPPLAIPASLNDAIVAAAR